LWTIASTKLEKEKKKKKRQKRNGPKFQKMLHFDEPVAKLG
jgi:hypothetical protein